MVREASRSELSGPAAWAAVAIASLLPAGAIAALLRYRFGWPIALGIVGYFAAFAAAGFAFRAYVRRRLPQDAAFLERLQARATRLVFVLTALQLAGFAIILALAIVVLVAMLLSRA